MRNKKIVLWKRLWTCTIIVSWPIKSIRDKRESSIWITKSCSFAAADGGKGQVKRVQQRIVAIRAAYRTGRGKIIVRSTAEIEEHNGRERIVVTEIPYMVNKLRLIEKIADLVKEKRVEGISDLYDASAGFHSTSSKKII